MIARSLAFVVLVALASGCMDGGTKTVETTIAEAPRPQLEGWVLSVDQSGIEGAMLRIEASNATATTSPEGRYAFGALPTDVPLIVTASANGYQVLSKSVTLVPDTSLTLNFTLEPIPVKKPYIDPQQYTGLVACQLVVVAAGDQERIECGGDDPNNKPIIEFTMGPDVAGVVLELVWESNTPLADLLEMRIETVGFGDQDEELATAIGPSILRAQINSFQAAKFYSGGGIARATIAAGTNPDDEESTVGAGLPLQQSFELYVTVFYVEGPLPTYSALT